ncbi:MAG: twin-arginine translocase subunit TatC, partial [Deltaproteobacteria bacterium]|nr:twin-arginine translocase subunit TatC [Deltaproteobacteria bacterium]
MAENEKGISIVGHLKELRRRLAISAIAAGAGFLVCYYYSERLYIVLTAPLMPALPEGQKFLAFTGIVEPFFIYMKVGLAGGIVLASPVILYEVWAFVAPALYEE